MAITGETMTTQARAIGAAAAAVLMFGLGVGLGHNVLAQGPPAEHDDTGAMGAGGHNTSQGVAHLCRPYDVKAEELKDTAKKLMKQLVCMCGGCKRETLYECRCSFAKQARCQVLSMLDEAHKVGASEDKAYEAVVDAFVKEYGGNHVLVTPKSSLSWLVPYVAIGGGLVLLYGFGRRWVKYGQQEVQALQPLSEEDEEYAEILDDELRDTD